MAAGWRPRLARPGGKGAEFISRQGNFWTKTARKQDIWRDGGKHRVALQAAEETRAGTLGLGRSCSRRHREALRVGRDKGICHEALLDGGDNGWHRQKGETTAGIVGTSVLKEAKLSPDL